MSTRVAVVTGANKGIGFAIVKALCQKFDGVVYLTSRDETRGQQSLSELKQLGLSPEFHQLDVADKDSVKRFADHIEKKHGGIDILINNAGVANGIQIGRPYEENKAIVDINYFSILTIKEYLFPLLRDKARVLNISSDCGHLSNVKNKYWLERLSKKYLTVEIINEFVNWYLESEKNGSFNPEDMVEGGILAAYRVAKVALSAITMVHQKELEARNIVVNSMHPGLVRTDMTTGRGFYSADDAAKTPVYLVLEAPDTLKGAYVWYDGQVIDWYDYNGDYAFKSSTLLD